jgi:hypothetical protein
MLIETIACRERPAKAQPSERQALTLHQPKFARETALEHLPE